MGCGLWRGAPEKDTAQGTLWGAGLPLVGVQPHRHCCSRPAGWKCTCIFRCQFSSVQSLSRVWLFATHGLQHASQILIRYQISIRFCNYKSMIILSADQTCGLWLVNSCNLLYPKSGVASLCWFIGLKKFQVLATSHKVFSCLGYKLGLSAMFKGQ